MVAGGRQPPAPVQGRSPGGPAFRPQTEQSPKRMVRALFRLTGHQRGGPLGWLPLRSMGSSDLDGQICEVFCCGRSCRRWHLGPGVDWDVPVGPGHLRRGRERCDGRRLGCSTQQPRQEHQRSVESVGAGAGSSARSWLMLRGGVVHSWSLRIPMSSRSDSQPKLATIGETLDMALHHRQRLFMKPASRCQRRKPGELAGDGTGAAPSPHCIAIAAIKLRKRVKTAQFQTFRHADSWTETLS